MASSPAQVAANRRHSESTTRNAKSGPTRFTKAAAQDNLISHVGDGLSIVAALEKVGRSRKAYEAWRRDEPEFKRRVDAAKAIAGTRSNKRVRGERLGFAEFRKKYLGTETFWHQLQWVDVLEGLEPRDLHSAQTYVRGKKSRLLVNVPPFHAKSQTITVDWVVWKLCLNPSFRVIIVSQSARLAEDFLFGIKQRLTHPDYIELQVAYAPDGGWKQTAESWKQNRIVVGSDDRSGTEKDPSVQAIGMGGQIYGSRCDAVIVDDAVTGANVREYEKQMAWLQREVSSRIEMGGKLLVVGTRIAPIDLYSELMDPENYGASGPPWTHFASPAILEEGATPAEHVTLWPVSDIPWQAPETGDECECGEAQCGEGFEVDGRRVFPRWDGVHLEKGPRSEVAESVWALVYQQRSMHERMIFPEHAVRKTVNTVRQPGILADDRPGCPPGGMHGMYVVAGCDPSLKGFAGLIIVAFDRKTGKRYLLNAYNVKAPTPDELKDRMKKITEAYGVNEWRVEKTGLLQFFTQDESFRLWFSARGVLFREHLTSGATKWDPSYGVASLSSLFGAYDKVSGTHGEDIGEYRQIAAPLIELPRASNGVRALVHQLITWTPDLDPKKIPCDLLMALWFVEVRCRELTMHDSNVVPFRRLARFESPASRSRRHVVNLAEYGSTDTMRGAR